MRSLLTPLVLCLFTLAACAGTAGAQGARLTAGELEAALDARPTGAAAAALAERVRALLGDERIRSGAARLEGTRVIWAIETDEPEPRVAHLGNIRGWALTRIGDTRIYAGVGAVPNFSLVAYQFEAGGKRLGGGSLQVEHFPTHPDSLVQGGVPRGKVSRAQLESRVFAGTVRDYWVYLPAQYDPTRPAALMVFQDGENYLNGAAVATVFDNLIARKDMPVTAGVFINPGRFADGRSNRSFEYDTLSDQYARFLRDEVLPEVRKIANISDDPERRAICGISSGGICAFTVAWEMPDQFRKVLSHVGSFVNIASGPTRREGGHNYPALLRKTPRKPLRIWLQAGANDLDNDHGNWPLANQEMAASLRYMGYDYRFDYGQGFHSLRHGAATLPDSLRWLWRDVR